MAPADLHCANWTFAHNGLLRQAGLECPETWADVLRIAAITREYRENGGMRSNTRYGYVHRERA